MADRRKNHSLRKYRKPSTSTNGSMTFFKDKKIIGIVAVVVVVVIALVLVLSLFGKDEADDTETSEQTTVAQETEVDPSTYKLEKDAVPGLKELVESYFNAMKSCDAEAYSSLVVGDEVTAEKLQKKGEFIEDYRNIVCYTKPGMVEDTYVAFVYYEIKFHNIDTPAPAMSQMYICSNADGSMYINAGELDEELSQYIGILKDDEELRQLEKDTDQKLADACAADEKLDAFMKLLLNIEPETEPETTTEPETDISEMVFEERNEKVITTTSVRIRSTPTTDSDDNILGKVEAGEELKRVGYNANWSKIIYDGKEAYISSEYVITK